MPRRNVILATDEIYHIFNRSIAKEQIFSSKILLRHILEIVNFYHFPQSMRLSKFKSLPKEMKKQYQQVYLERPPLVEIYTFAFMPNHYHLLLKQSQEGGIVKFVANIQNSFAKIYNLTKKRDGSVFQSPFKARRIETEEQFIHISRYIHLNPVTAYIITFEDLRDYPWTSFHSYIQSYIQESPSQLISAKFLLSFFKSREDYARFVSDQEDYQKRLAEIKHLIIKEI